MSVLLGLTASGWWRLLKENDFAVDPPYWGKAAMLSVLGTRNSRYRRKEDQLFGDAVARVQIRPPLFILGHWRNGTTLLHNLFALDSRFAFPNLFEVTHPHTFLIREPQAERHLWNAPPERRPMDNMEVTFQSPGEDESGVAVLSLRSSLLGWLFPRREEYYDRYLTFRDVPEPEFEEWKRAFLFFLRKLTYKYKKPLVLKSPAHTARIRTLLEIFPDARFVHVHRNPYTVFRSTQHLYRTSVAESNLQRPRPTDSREDGILRRYATIYDAFFEERPLIPEGQFHEVCFEELESDMICQVQGIYRALGLEGFDAVRPALEGYVNSISGYRKNRYTPMDPAMRGMIARRWCRSFEAWGYPE